MPDITLCKDKSCTLREQCYRFTAEPSDNQYYYQYSPYDSESGDCEFYFNNKPYEKTTD